MESLGWIVPICPAHGEALVSRSFNSLIDKRANSTYSSQA